MNKIESNFDLWVRGCEINHSLVYCLEGSGDNGFYKLTRQLLVKNNYYYDTPVFIGWVKGRQVVANTNYIEAYNVWHDRLRSQDEEDG